MKLFLLDTIGDIVILDFVLSLHVLYKTLYTNYR